MPPPFLCQLSELSELPSGIRCASMPPEVMGRVCVRAREAAGRGDRYEALQDGLICVCMLIPAGGLVVDHVCRSPGQVRHDVLHVQVEQLPGRDLVVHEHAGAAQELHGL